MVGRRLDAARTRAVAAVLAEVPMKRNAWVVSARASAPVCNEDGEVPNRWAPSGENPGIDGGKRLSCVVTDGGRLTGAGVWRVDGVKANGGVVDSANGGE
jgi:hypothetical protein